MAVNSVKIWAQGHTSGRNGYVLRVEAGDTFENFLATRVHFEFNEAPLASSFSLSDCTIPKNTYWSTVSDEGLTQESDNPKHYYALLVANKNVESTGEYVSLDLAKVTDAAGNRGSGTFHSEGVFTIDTVPPTLSAPTLGSATVNGDQLVLTYIEGTTLDGAALTDNAGFTVSNTAGTAITVRSAVVNATAKTVTLTLSRAVTQAETVKVSYTKPTSGAVIQDAVGNDAVSFSDRAVTNNTPAPADTTPPVFSSATVNGNQLVLTYTEANSLDATALTGNAGFAVSSTTGTAITVSSAVVNATAKTVTLTLSRAVANAETVSVSYTKPASGAVVQDAAGNDAANFSDRAVINNTPAPADTTPPVFSSAAVRGDQLVISYTEANTLNGATLTGNAGFTVSSTTGTAITVNSAVVNATAKTVTLTLSRAVSSAETVTFSYAKPATGGVQDAAGNNAADLSSQAVTNNTPAPGDTTPPVLSSATVNGNLLELTYTDASNLDARKTAAASAFAVVSMGNAAIRVDSVAVSGKTVTLTLSRTVAGGETVKLKYTKPETGDNVIQDVAGNDAASFMDRAVSNLVPDTTAPVLGSATVHSNQLVLIYIDAAGLDALKTATSSAFAVSSAGNAAISVNSVAVVGKTVTLMLSRAVAGGEALNLSYTRPATGDNVIQDAAGNAATSFTDRDVLNLAQDGVAPVFRSATVRGNQLVLTYTDATDLNAEQTAAASAFVVLSAGNAAISVNSVLVSGKTVTLTLSREVAGGEALDLDYIRPETGENVIQDAAGNPAVSF
ncbi:SwmB domain-containing protein, partial [Verminephrobacter aporrectodeae]